MAKLSTLTSDQQAQIQSFKDFLTGGALTKAGQTVQIDPATGFIMTKANTILAKGVVKNVAIPQQPTAQNPTPAPKVQDVAMFWDMNCSALGNDAFSLVQPITV